MTANGPYGDRFGPFTVNVIKPDGTNDTLGHSTLTLQADQPHTTPQQQSAHTKSKVLSGGMTHHRTPPTTQPHAGTPEAISNPNT